MEPFELVPREPGPSTAPKPPRKPRKNSRHGWSIEPHVCRACMGRVLARDTPKGREFCCSNCGVTGTDTVSSICSCGAKFNTGKDIGIRCMRNPNVTATSPSLFVSGEPDV